MRWVKLIENTRVGSTFEKGGVVISGRVASHPMAGRRVFSPRRGTDKRTRFPLGSAEMIAQLEKMKGRRLGREKPGPKDNDKSKGNQV